MPGGKCGARHGLQHVSEGQADCLNMRNHRQEICGADRRTVQPTPRRLGGRALTRGLRHRGLPCRPLAVTAGAEPRFASPIASPIVLLRTSYLAVHCVALDVAFATSHILVETRCTPRTNLIVTVRGHPRVTQCAASSANDSERCRPVRWLPQNCTHSTHSHGRFSPAGLPSFFQIVSPRRQFYSASALVDVGFLFEQTGVVNIEAKRRLAVLVSTAAQPRLLARR